MTVKHFPLGKIRKFPLFLKTNLLPQPNYKSWGPGDLNSGRGG